MVKYLLKSLTVISSEIVPELHLPEGVIILSCTKWHLENHATEWLLEFLEPVKKA